MNTDERLERLTTWVRQFDGLEAAEPVPASGDASFRRYFRVQGEDSYIVMDAPPLQEDCRPFVDIAGYLAAIGLNSPRILQSDIEGGFLLLSDLGATQFLDAIENGTDPDSLYADAMHALQELQTKGWKYQSRLPPYDDALLRTEMSLLQDWLCEKHLGLDFSEADELAWQTTCDVLVDNALEQPTVFVHRDYHSRNLMVTEQDNPGVLDFQDAMEGPYTYDIVSLLKDCYVKWPPDRIADYANHYFDNQSFESDVEQFTRHFDLMGVQRHLKASGIFARLLHRDGKTGYMKDVPRTLSYVTDVSSQYAELGWLGDFISGRVAPALESHS